MDKKMTKNLLLVLMCYCCYCNCLSINDDKNSDKEDLSDTVKLLQEQVDALLRHRQEDYNNLEENLKSSIEKNTELKLLRKELKQLR